MAQSPEFRAFSKAKSDLVRQLNFSLTFLRNECSATDPPLLSFDEDLLLGGSGSTSAQDTSKLLDIVLTRIRCDPQAFYTFRSIDTLTGGANQPLAAMLDRYLEEERQKQMRQHVSGNISYGGGRPQSTPTSASVSKAHPTPTCSLDDYLSTVTGQGLDKALDEEITDLHQAIVSKSIANWQELLPFFELREVDRHTILGNNPHSTEVQRREMLSMWHSRRGRRNASYRELAKVFFKAEKPELVEKVVKILGYDPPPWPVPRSAPAPVHHTNTPQLPSPQKPSPQQPDSMAPCLYPSKPPTKRELMRLLYQEASHQWLDIGSCLNIKTPDLKTIERKCLGDPKPCLVELLNLWLDKTDPPPSWQEMGETLEIIGRHDLVKKICEMNNT